MACPYFCPQQRLDENAWTRPPRLPLGDPYAGVCRVDPIRESRPGLELLRDCCNTGYPREKCPHFPKEAEADAVRFAVTNDAGDAIAIFYVAERDHRSVEYGDFEYSLETGAFVSGPCGGLLEDQARSYIDSYVRRKLEPELAVQYPNRR